MGLSFNRKSVGVAGSIGIGSVTSIGPGVQHFFSDDKVLIVNEGVWTETTNVPASTMMKIPKSYTVEEAACLPSILAAYNILNNTVKLVSGDTVLQTSGESAIGSAVAEVGKAMGLNVINVTTAQLEDVKFIDKMKGSVKLAICGSAKKSATKSLLRSLGDYGTMVVYQGPIESLENIDGVEIPVSASIFKFVNVMGFNFQTWASTDLVGYKAAVEAVTGMVETKKISLKNVKSFAFPDYAAAFATVETTGGMAVLKM